MSDEKRKRLSIAEKRALRTTLNLGAEYRQPDDDPDADWLNVDLPDTSHKKPISFRVDPDVLDFFKSEGPGYQTRMNAVLLAYMQAKKKLRQT
jgi:uncharacterized protein (DUF4415 family)